MPQGVADTATHGKAPRLGGRGAFPHARIALIAAAGAAWLGLMGLPAAKAGAATLSVVGDQIQYDHGGSVDGFPEESDVLVSRSGNDLRFEEGFEDLSAGASCTEVVAKAVVTCPAAGVTRINMALGQGDDFVEVESSVDVVTEVHAGTGDDDLTGSTERVEFYGDDGFDDLEGSDSADLLDGGDGGDVIVADDGDDMLDGGGGHDLLVGDAGNDTIDAKAGNDELDGGPGDDVLTGNSGDDIASYPNATGPVNVSLSTVGPQVTGGAGTDVLDGIKGLSGGPFGDVLTGTANADTLIGNGGADLIDAGNGNDTIDVFDGIADTVLCGGGGNDDGTADQFDLLTDCENVTITQFNPPAPPAAPPPTAVAAPAPVNAAVAPPGSASLRGSRSVRLSRNRARLAVRCGTGGNCAGAVKLVARSRGKGRRSTRSRRVVVGRAKFEIARGETKRIGIRINSRGRRLLRRNRRLRVSATVTALDGTRQATRKLTLTSSRRKRR